jgi:predicted  nucleic acid-binding Zn-ribbon protein
MNDIEQEAKMISATIKWWNDEVSAVVERLEILHNQDIKNEEEINKAENKLSYLYKKGSSEVKNIDRFFKKWDLD